MTGDLEHVIQIIVGFRTWQRRAYQLVDTQVASIMALTLDKVLISDAVDASCCSILKTHGVNVDYRPGLSKDELLSIIKVTFLASL